MTTRTRIAPLRTAGLALGMGLGGFVDGIVFHQILQLHQMLSARVPTDVLVGAKVNMVWDGLFHAGVWLLTVAGIALLWRACRRDDAVLSGRLLLGAAIAGWGVFNVVEGIVDHLLLQVHHVVEARGLSVWDYVFVGAGVALIGAGFQLARGAERR